MYYLPSPSSMLARPYTYKQYKVGENHAHRSSRRTRFARRERGARAGRTAHKSSKIKTVGGWTHTRTCGTQRTDETSGTRGRSAGASGKPAGTRTRGTISRQSATCRGWVRSVERPTMLAAPRRAALGSAFTSIKGRSEVLRHAQGGASSTDARARDRDKCQVVLTPRARGAETGARDGRA